MVKGIDLASERPEVVQGQDDQGVGVPSNEVGYPLQLC